MTTNYTRKRTQRGAGGTSSKPAAAGKPASKPASKPAAAAAAAAAAAKPADIAALGQSVRGLTSGAASMRAAVSDERRAARAELAATRKAERAKNSEERKEAREEAAAARKASREAASAARKAGRQVAAAAGEIDNAAGVGLENINAGLHNIERLIANANERARNMEYAGLSNSARARVHRANTTAINIASKRDLDGLIKKFKKTKKQYKQTLRSANEHADLEKLLADADYLERLANELLKHIERKDTKNEQYLHAAVYSPKSNSPISPNSD